MKKNIVVFFYALFAVCFTFVIINVILQNEYYKTFHLIVATALCAVGLILIYKLLGKYSDFLEKHYMKILLIFTAVLFIIQAAIGISLRYDPQWDVGAVQKGAIEWVQTGTFESYKEYFSQFPNNLGLTMFLTIFLKIVSLFGIKDFFAAGVVINSALICAAIALSSLICRRLSDAKHGIFILALFAVSAQYWFMGGAVYTDTLSMLFPVLTYWLYLKASDTCGKKQILMYVLIGIIAAIGCLVKFTVIIMAIAIVIDMCFKQKPKEILKAAACIGAAAAVVAVSFNAYVYSFQLDRDTVHKIGRPHSHWVMMGLSGDGRYNSRDYEFTDSFSDPDEKREAINKEIGKRVKSLGVVGLYDLAKVKSAINFGDGTYGIADFLGCFPKNDNKLHEWVLYDGEYYNIYGTYSTAVHIAIMIFMLAMAYALVFRQKNDRESVMALFLAVLGVWMFLLMWETNRRYFSNFAPVIFILGALGVDSFIYAWKKLAEKIKINLK